mgnify:CR=1 FL=1
MNDLKSLLYQCIDTLGLNHKITVEISQLLDKEIVNEQVKYDCGSV